jgi:hypothetical protein
MTGPKSFCARPSVHRAGCVCATHATRHDEMVSAVTMPPPPLNPSAPDSEPSSSSSQGGSDAAAVAATLVKEERLDFDPSPVPVVPDDDDDHDDNPPAIAQHHQGDGAGTGGGGGGGNVDSEPSKSGVVDDYCAHDTEIPITGGIGAEADTTTTATTTTATTTVTTAAEAAAAAAEAAVIPTSSTKLEASPNEHDDDGDAVPYDETQQGAILDAAAVVVRVDESFLALDDEEEEEPQQYRDTAGLRELLPMDTTPTTTVVVDDAEYHIHTVAAAAAAVVVQSDGSDFESTSLSVHNEDHRLVIPEAALNETPANEPPHYSLDTVVAATTEDQLERRAERHGATDDAAAAAMANGGASITPTRCTESPTMVVHSPQPSVVVVPHGDPGTTTTTTTAASSSSSSSAVVTVVTTSSNNNKEAGVVATEQDCGAAAVAAVAESEPTPPLVPSSTEAVTAKDTVLAAALHDDDDDDDLNNAMVMVPEPSCPNATTTTVVHDKEAHEAISDHCFTDTDAAAPVVTATITQCAVGSGGVLETVEATTTAVVDPDAVPVPPSVATHNKEQEEHHPASTSTSTSLTVPPPPDNVVDLNNAHIGSDQSATTTTTTATTGIQPIDEEAQAVTTGTTTDDDRGVVTGSASGGSNQVLAHGMDVATTTHAAPATSSSSSETNEASAESETAAAAVAVTSTAVEASDTNVGLPAVVDIANPSSAKVPVTIAAASATVEGLAPLVHFDGTVDASSSKSPMDQPSPKVMGVIVSTSETALASEVSDAAGTSTLVPVDSVANGNLDAAVVVVEDSRERTKADSAAAAPVEATTKSSLPAVKTKAKSFVAPATTTTNTNIASLTKQRKKLAIPSIFEKGPASTVASFTPTTRTFSPKKLTNPFEKSKESERPLSVATGFADRRVTPTAFTSPPGAPASKADADSNQADPTVLGEADAATMATNPLPKGKADKAETDGAVKRKLAIPSVFAAPKSAETFVPPKTPTKVWIKKVASMPAGPCLPLSSHGRGNVSVTTSIEKSTISKIAPVEGAALQSKVNSKVKPTNDHSKWSPTSPAGTAAAAPSQTQELSLGEQIAALEAEIAQTAAEAAVAAAQAPPVVVGEVEYEEVSYYEEVDASENTLESMEEMHLLSCQTKAVMEEDRAEKLEKEEIPTSVMETEMVENAKQAMDTLSTVGAQSTLDVALSPTDQDSGPNTSNDEVDDPLRTQDADSSIASTDREREIATVIQQHDIPLDEDPELNRHKIPLNDDTPGGEDIPSNGEHIELSTTKSDACVEVNELAATGSTSATSLNVTGDCAGATATLEAVNGKKHHDDLDVAKESAISSTDPHNVDTLDDKAPNNDSDDAKEAALPPSTNPKDAKGDKASVEGEQLPRKKMRRLRSFFQNVKEKSKRRLLPGARVKAPKSHA